MRVLWCVICITFCLNGCSYMLELSNFDHLIKPSWGTEKWILEGWNKLNNEEKASIGARVDDLFKDGLPFEMKHDKLLYVYAFSLMAQLEVLGIQLPLRFVDIMQNPEFKQKMRVQLVDEVFHAIAFTKIIFMLVEPYSSPPVYNEKVERICNFVRSQDCLKMGMVVMNLVCEGLVEEVFTIFYEQGIAPKLFKLIIDDEHRHVCEADLYREIGLPDQEKMNETLENLEDLIINAFTLEPKFTIAINALLGPVGAAKFSVGLKEKHKKQLKKLNRVPGEKWDLIFEVAPELQADFQYYAKEIDREMNLEVNEVEMSPTKKMLMTELNNPGDPTMVAQFNLDVTDFYETNKYDNEVLTALMMQAMSHVLFSNDSFRCFLSFKKFYQSRSAYLAIIDKLPDCNGHLSTVYFKDCHEMPVNKLLEKIQRSKQMMSWCYKKREQIEKEYPELKRDLDESLYDEAHSLYPCPLPGSQSVFLCNIGSYGYNQGVIPLAKHTGFHILLLAVEKKPVWDKTSQSFVARDILPISISADARIFDGLFPMPDALNKGFQAAFQKMKEQEENPLLRLEKTESQKKEDKITDELLSKVEKIAREKLLLRLTRKNKDFALKEAKRIFGEDLIIHGKKLSEHSDYQALADKLLADYLNFDAKEAEQDIQFNKIVNKLLAEDRELGYRILHSFQSSWIDYKDVEETFQTASKKLANLRLSKLAKFLPTILKK